MKRLSKLFLATLFMGTVGASVSFRKQPTQKVEAAEETTYPRNGQSGTVMLVNGMGTYFKSGEADLAICCWDGSTYAWSERSNYRVSSDLIRIMIPYLGGQSKTWSYFKVCRYNPGLDPTISTDSGVYNATDAISFSSLMYAQNTINITGYNGSKLNYSLSSNNIHGIKGESHMYLDLGGFTDWENDEAKFAIYFGCPASSNRSEWSKANEIGNAYYSSFCWKVNGQDNDHLYECIVPNIYSGESRNIWNLVIAVRFGKEAYSPNWEDHKYNQTGNLSFNSGNTNANMIRITGWNDGYIDSENIISDDSRADFFGNYFLNTVSCSGTGDNDATTNDMWNAVTYEYQHHLSRLMQGKVWKTVGDKEGNAIEQAIARYDYIIFYKEYNHEDFINRVDSENKTQFAPYSTFINSYENTNTAFLIVAIATMSLVSVCILLLVKKTKIKENKQ